MKKTLPLLLTFTLCLGIGFAQTNMDLELWAPNGAGGEDPNGWGTLNGFMFLGAPQTTWKDTITPGEGLTSAKLESINFPGATGFGAPSDTVGAMLSIGGPVGFGPLGIPYTKKPTSVDFLVKANPMGSDTGLVLVQLTHWDGSQTVYDGQGIMVFPVQIPVWTSVSIPITYFTSGTPDTLEIIAASSGVMLGFVGVGAQTPGSQLFLDSFALVLPANTAPVATDDAATTDSAVAVTVDVQANDMDAEGGPMTTTVISGPSNGTTNVVGTDIVYTPNAGFTGTDTLMYQLCDDGSPALCDTATLVITVTSPPPPTNTAPTASNDAATTDEDVAVTVGILANDSDPQGDPLTATIVTQPGNGTAVVSGDSITYTPGAGFYGTDTVVYQVCDDGTPPLCDTASLIVTVNQVIGIKSAVAHSGIVLYPNPVSSNVLNVAITLEGVAVLHILDMLGKQLVSVALKDALTSVNVSELSSGMYLYQVKDKSGILLSNGNFTVIE